MEKIRCANFKKMLTIGVFLFFFIITCYKLTNSPLWFDETIEYWYSKILVGDLPFKTNAISDPTNMYERIISTFQPPLYNFLMFFWLKVNESEWWFRFFGVLMGFIYNLATYKLIKKTSNEYVAAIAVIISTCTFQLVYYWQECSEYCLMLANLSCTIYFFVCLLEEQNKKSILLFVIFSILSIYSQYGSAFPVISMLVIAYAYIFLKKDKENFKFISILYVCAFFVAAVPLWFLFLSKQIINQQGSGNVMYPGICFDFGIFKELFLSFAEIVRWNLFSFFEDGISLFFSLLFIIISVFDFLCQKKNFIKPLVLINIIAFLLYYIAVKMGIYSYGIFGNRYNLFFLPLWIASFICFCVESYKIISKSLNNQLLNNFIMAVSMLLILFFCYSNWDAKLSDNWIKEDMRGAFNSWVEHNGYESNTIVYYGGDSSFAYYLRQSEVFNDEIEDKVNYMFWDRNKSEDEYEAYFYSTYGYEWPKEIYIIGSHIKDDLLTIISVFTDKGYEEERVYNELNGVLIKLTKC